MEIFLNFLCGFLFTIFILYSLMFIVVSQKFVRITKKFVVIDARNFLAHWFPINYSFQISNLSFPKKKKFFQILSFPISALIEVIARIRSVFHSSQRSMMPNRIVCSRISFSSLLIELVKMMQLIRAATLNISQKPSCWQRL